MPRDIDYQPYCLDVAVIGSGVAGLAAAWLLSKTQRVTVYEQEGRIGGHSNTVNVSTGTGPVGIDTGFIVYNELNYPNLTALFAHLGVETQKSEMSFAVSMGGGDLEYAGSSIARLFGQPRNLLRRRFWHILRDIRRFYREGSMLAIAGDNATLSLGAYLDRERYSESFISDHLLPMAAAIWSTDTASMRAYPALAFVRFCMNHGLMQVSGRPRWRSVVGGSRSYVQRLTASFSDRIMINARVTGLTRTPAGVVVEDANGAVNRFDKVVIATHADQALSMLADPSDDERRLLGAFRYRANVAVLHRDRRLMPKRKRVWSSWNYIDGRTPERHRRPKSSARPALADLPTPPSAAERVCVTYWMNRLQNVDTGAPVFVTLNPHTPPEPKKTLKTFNYHHPMFDAEALRAQAQLHRLQGRRSTWFCGSYFGAGFHEDALASGLAVGEALGGARRPWAETGGATAEGATEGYRSAAE
ncbi:MAG: FAD-dependent oxidoreductase [Rhodospirillales bacterium]|nr:FAD-dependent oxidoreductase [Rhodospirillales bacterium]